MKSFLKTILFTTVGLIGCGNIVEQNGQLPNEIRPHLNLEDPMIGATDAIIIGDIGPVENIDSNTDMVEVWDQENYVSVEVVSQLQFQAVMMRFSTQNREFLYPGTNETFYFNESDTKRPLLLLGCVGQEVDMWTTWDKPADEATIITMPGTGPNEVDVLITGNWYSSDTEATTAFTIQR